MARTESEKRMRNMSLLVVLAGAGFFVGKKLIGDLIDNIRARREGNQYDSNNAKQALASQVATRFNSAFNPSGNKWMRSWDQTDEKAVFECARDMAKNKVSMSMVTTSYRGLFQRELVSDLQSELDSRELQLFNSILTSSDPELAYKNAMLQRFGKIDGLNLAGFLT